MLEIQKKKQDLANMSLSQTMSKKELHEKRMEDLKVRRVVCLSSSLLQADLLPTPSRPRLSSLSPSAHPPRLLSHVSFAPSLSTYLYPGSSLLFVCTARSLVRLFSPRIFLRLSWLRSLFPS